MPKQSKKLTEEQQNKILLFCRYYEMAKGERCRYEDAITKMFDLILKIDEDFKNIENLVIYNSDVGRLRSKYG